MAPHGGRTYKIGEAARLLELEPYVLRFWEEEFPQLRPLRTARGQRLYTEEHLQLIRRIKHLLYKEGMTIDGAKQRLDDLHKWGSLLREIREDIQEIKRLLGSSGS
ncbi:MAG: MerR family transcriptional regulator [Desulfohalobiaceae bacterium]|nr:MerR family transcriptional regulator [Desulfohalobiaceae bacterium]